MKMKAIVIMILCALLSSPLFAAPDWDGGALTTDWHTATNWNPDAIPNGDDDATIGGTPYIGSYPIIVDIAADANALSLVIGTGTSAPDVTTVNLNSGLLTVGGDLTIGMAGDVGKVTFIADSNSVIGDDLKVGEDAGSDGVFDANDVYVDVADDIRVGEDGEGNATLTNVLVDEANRLRVGAGDTGNGMLILNGSTEINIASIGGGKDSRVGNGAGTTGTLEMNDTSSLYIDKGDDNNELRIANSSGTGVIEMNDTSYLYVEENLRAGANGTGDATVTMTGGEISVDNKTYFGGSENDTYWLPGDNTRGILTMSGEALFYSNDYFYFGIESDPNKATDLANRNQLIMSDNAKISVRDGDQNMYIASNAGSYAYVEVNDDAEINCKDLEIGRNGGGCDLTVNDGRLNIDDHFKVASSVDSPTAVDPVNILFENDALIDIENRFRIGGLGAQVTITLKKAQINMADQDDNFSMPYSGLSGATGYSVIILGEDANDISYEALLQIDGPLDSDYAGDNDYIDFLGGSRLTTQQNKITEQEIKDLIISGYFRTTYTKGESDDLGGDPNVFRPVYSENTGESKWEIELGIGDVCVDPVGDLNGDCYVDINDLRLFAKDEWLSTADMEGLADISARWEKCGKAYGYTCP